MILSSHKPWEAGSCRSLDVKSKKQHWPNIAGTFYRIRKNCLVFISSQSQACFKQMEKNTLCSPSSRVMSWSPRTTWNKNKLITITTINSRSSSLPSTAGHHDHPGNHQNPLHCHCQKNASWSNFAEVTSKWLIVENIF